MFYYDIIDMVCTFVYQIEVSNDERNIDHTLFNYNESIYRCVHSSTPWGKAHTPCVVKYVKPGNEYRYEPCTVLYRTREGQLVHATQYDNLAFNILILPTDVENEPNSLMKTDKDIQKINQINYPSRYWYAFKCITDFDFIRIVYPGQNYLISRLNTITLYKWTKKGYTKRIFHFNFDTIVQGVLNQIGTFDSAWIARWMNQALDQAPSRSYDAIIFTDLWRKIVYAALNTKDCNQQYRYYRQNDYREDYCSIFHDMCYKSQEGMYKGYVVVVHDIIRREIDQLMHDKLYDPLNELLGNENWIFYGWLSNDEYYVNNPHYVAFDLHKALSYSYNYWHGDWQSVEQLCPLPCIPPPEVREWCDYRCYIRSLMNKIRRKYRSDEECVTLLSGINNACKFRAADRAKYDFLTNCPYTRPVEYKQKVKKFMDKYTREMKKESKEHPEYEERIKNVIHNTKYAYRFLDENLYEKLKNILQLSKNGSLSVEALIEPIENLYDLLEQLRNQIDTANKS